MVSELSDPFSWLPQILVQLWLTPVQFQPVKFQSTLRFHSTLKFRSILARFRTPLARLQSIRFRWIKTSQLRQLRQIFCFKSQKSWTIRIFYSGNKNFLLWWQQIEPAISALGLNRFVANPQIPPWYLSDVDHDLDCVSPLFLMWHTSRETFLLYFLFPGFI